MKDDYDIEDLEAFIKGLKDTIDFLDEVDPEIAQEFQQKIAKAISMLQYKKIAKIASFPKFDKKDVKNFLCNKLEFLLLKARNLDPDDISVSERIKFVKNIAKLKEYLKNINFELKNIKIERLL